MLILFQVFFSLFALFAALSVLKKRKAGLLSALATLFWICFWGFGIFVVFNPGFVQTLADTFEIGRGSDFVLYLSVALIFYIIFRMQIKIEKQQKEITLLARKYALKEKK